MLWGFQKFRFLNNLSAEVFYHLRCSFKEWGKNPQDSESIKKYGLSADRFDNMLNPSEGSWSSRIALKIQEELVL